MKALTLLFIAASLTSAAQAQLVVTNPVSDVLSEEQHLEDLGKWVQSINNQVQQITTLTQQLQQIRAYVTAAGDPKRLLNIVGADALSDSLQTSGVGQTLGELQSVANGAEALQNSANGLYQSVGQTFSTPTGVRIPRAEALYRKFVATDQAQQNFERVYAEVTQRRTVLKKQLAETTQKLQASSTDAETQKLSGVVSGYNAELASLDQEVHQAFAESAVIDIQNRADREKQELARQEEQKAEFGEAMSHYAETFQISDAPAAFPTR